MFENLQKSLRRRAGRLLGVEGSAGQVPGAVPTHPLDGKSGALEAPQLPSKAFRSDNRRAHAALVQLEAALATGDTRAAEAAAVDALLIEPGWHRSFHSLARVLETQGRTVEATTAWQGVLAAETLARLVPDFAGSSGPDDHDARYERIELHGIERHDLLRPGGTGQPSDHFDRQRIVTKPSFVDRVPGGSVWQDSSNTLVLDARGTVIVEHSKRNPQLVRHLSLSHEPVPIDGRLIVLGGPGSGNFYHWMTDMLPKIGLLDDAGIVRCATDRYLVPIKRPSFQLPSLARVGIREDQIVFCNDLSPWFTASELLVPHLANAMGLSMARWVPEWLQDRFRSPGERTRPASRRLFVDRDARAAQGREVDNADEIRALLLDRGFEIVFPERLDVTEQADLFHHADVVLAPHGAGLTNIVHCRPGTRVLEFYGDHFAPCYWAISNLLGLDYYAHHCTPSALLDEHDDARTLFQRRASGFAISLTDLEAMLDAAGVTAAGEQHDEGGLRQSA